MAQRELDPRLKALFDAKKKVYSISKLNTIDQCEYQAYLSYVKHAKQSSSCYSILGTRIHDCLEAIINGESTEEDLLPALDKELEDMEMLGIDFPNDRNGGTTIRDNWIADMKDFCTSFVKPKGKFETEQLFIYQLDPDHYLQGYIDLIRYNSDDTISIFDWKTSSQFATKDLIHYGRQLVLYSMGKEQEGYKVKNVAWIMLKYAEVSWRGKARKTAKTETTIKKVFNRSKVLKELKPYLETDLEKLGYNEIDIEILLEDAVKLNSWDKIPEEVRNKYTIKPYVRYYELTDELKQETLDYINTRIAQFESKSNSEVDWEPVKITPKDDYFCRNLCGHRLHCKYLTDYLNTKEDPKKDELDDLF